MFKRLRYYHSPVKLGWLSDKILENDAHFTRGKIIKVILKDNHPFMNEDKSMSEQPVSVR